MDLKITENAKLAIKKFLSESDDGNSFLRISVVGGGCSGLSYKLGIEKEKPNEDLLFEFDEIKVIIDKKSALFITNLEIDYSSGLTGTGFSFKNPNAKRTCGCGSSFGI